MNRNEAMGQLNKTGEDPTLRENSLETRSKGCSGSSILLYPSYFEQVLKIKYMINQVANGL